MRLQAEDAVSREWLEELVYYMMEHPQHSHHCYTFHNLEIIAFQKPFAFSGPLPVPACVRLDPVTDRFMLLLYYPIISRLPLEAKIAVMEHEGIHLLDGHLSTYGTDLVNVYGRIHANYAMDLYVNQKINAKALADAGLPPVTIDDYGFPPDLSSFEYAELLRQLPEEQQPQEPKLYIILPDGSVIDKDGNPVPEGELPFDPQEGQGGKPGDDFTGKGQFRVSEVFDVSEKQQAIADEATRGLIESVTSALEAAGLQDKARGLHGADHEQFIKAAERTPIVPWTVYLRQMECLHRQDFVVPTRRRPSRRHPAYFGRVRRYGLECAFLVDTSGSMGEEQLRLVDPELRGVYSRGAHIKIVHCDASVAHIEDYNPRVPLETFHGRGGTDYSDAFLKLRELPNPPGFLVGYTDGWGCVASYVATITEERGEAWYNEYVAKKPTRSPDGMETLWLIPEGCMDPDEFTETVCPWGTVVVVPLVK